MRLARVFATSVGCLLALAALASGQNIQPGLYENSSEVTWQQSPFPPGMRMPAGASSPFGEGKHTNLVCVTQAEIDRYGAVLPERWGNDCHLTSVHRRASGLNAELVCTGTLEGQGTVEAVWAVEGGGRGKVHFTGQMKTARFALPIEFTSVYVSLYKGRDCGSVKPDPMPSE